MKLFLKHQQDSIYTEHLNTHNLKFIEGFKILDLGNKILKLNLLKEAINLSDDHTEMSNSPMMNIFKLLQ